MYTLIPQACGPWEFKCTYQATKVHAQVAKPIILVKYATNYCTYVIQEVFLCNIFALATNNQ